MIIKMRRQRSYLRSSSKTGRQKAYLLNFNTLWGMMPTKRRQELSDAHEAGRQARIAVLQEETDFIHFANELYWRQANSCVAAKAEYYRRQDRLEKIRRELAELRKAWLSGPQPDFFFNLNSATIEV